jgi:formylglycine-generating enzyme required for sulfatase activity
LDDGRFHEVYRTVPENPHVVPSGGASHLFWANRTDGRIEWPEITIPQLEISAGMAEFSGAERFQMGTAGDAQVPPHRRYVGSFLLDTHEMTWAEFLKHNKNQPPPSLMHLDGQLPASDLPVSGIWFNDAVSFAEGIGKRLPTEAEYEFAATSGGTRTFPWGDDVARIQEWPLGPTGTPEFDAVQANVPVYGLYSNVAEWTASWGSAYPPLMDYLPGLQPRTTGMWIVRGGPYSVITGNPVPAEFSFGPRQRVAQNELNLQKGLGFRCARSKQPRLNSSDLERYERD